MTRETFEQETFRCLEEHLRRCPYMEQQDIVKFVFQALLGVGHLLSTREAVTDYAAREMAPLSAAAGEPLYEPVSPAWCRLNLRRAKAEGFTPSAVAGLMLSSAAPFSFTRQDVYDCCRRLADSGKNLITDPAALEQILDETWLPAHSAGYRERACPAYRVISAEWIPRMDALKEIVKAPRDRALITVDGPCATGKTTLAGKLADVFGAAVVHTDDYVIPHPRKTAERLAVPGGNCDDERLVREVAAPWKQGKQVVYRKYNFRNDCLMPEETLPDCRFLILEGSYCNLPSIRKYADLRIFVSAPWATRVGRLEKRESPMSLQMFYDRWIPLEDRYFEAFGLPDPDCVVLRQEDL